MHVLSSVFLELCFYSRLCFLSCKQVENSLLEDYRTECSFSVLTAFVVYVKLLWRTLFVIWLTSLWLSDDSAQALPWRLRSPPCRPRQLPALAAPWPPAPASILWGRRSWRCGNRTGSIQQQYYGYKMMAATSSDFTMVSRRLWEASVSGESVGFEMNNSEVVTDRLNYRETGHRFCQTMQGTALQRREGWRGRGGNYCTERLHFIHCYS